jgi:hypothetical protein
LNESLEEIISILRIWGKIYTFESNLKNTFRSSTVSLGRRFEEMAKEQFFANNLRTARYSLRKNTDKMTLKQENSLQNIFPPNQTG